MIEFKNTLFFESDDEFIDFVLCQNPVVASTESGIHYYDYPFTQEYEDAISAGKEFSILDYNSKVTKRGCVYRGIITKRVQNLVDGAYGCYTKKQLCLKMKKYSVR